MKQKKKKDEPPPPPTSAAADEQPHQLCNGGDPTAKRPKKSALKRTATIGGGSSKATGSKSGKGKRRVQFNESLNVFFESDYVIVIRDDDCDFDEEDFDFWSQQPCSCGDASCFQPWLQEDEDGGRGLPPPLDPYEEQPGTLSPPDGYKDGCPRHVPPQLLDHLKYDDDLSTRYNSNAADRSCSDTHVGMQSPNNSTSYFKDNNHQNVPAELSSQPRSNKHEQLLQQPPPTNANAVQLSKANSICDMNNSSAAQQPRCIVETITMTTVTERQIVQQTRPADGAKTEDLNAGTVSVPAVADEGYVLIKCGNNTVVYNNRNPNSAVRQLFPATKFVCPPTRIKETDDARLLNKYLITEESLRAFDSRSLNGGLGGAYKSDAHNDDDDDDDDTSNSLIRRTIERSTLRRNTAKKKNCNNDAKEISLIEKIRRLTCDSEDDADDPAKNGVAIPDQVVGSTAAQQSSAPCDPLTLQACTAAPAYKKLTELFGNTGRHEHPLPLPCNQPTTAGGDPIGKSDPLDLCDGHCSAVTAANNRAAVRSVQAGGKPFLSTLATACVTGNMYAASSGDTVTAAAGAPQPSSQCPQPDVVAGTQAPGSRRHEELAAFVQQDSGRLEKIRKRYMPPPAATTTTTGSSSSGQLAENEDDENDDYGFNRRPEVHGIRSGFSAQITIKNNQQRPRSYYGDPAGRPPPPPPPPAIEIQPDFVPVTYPPAGTGAQAASRARVHGDPRAPPPPYPAASQRSIIRVTHGQQQQTIRVPYQAVGPVQVHLLTTATAAATNVTGHPSSQVQIRPNEYIVQHGHARIHHGQQFVIARGTQTAAISTTRYYQLPPPPPPNHPQQLQQQLPQLPPQNNNCQPVDNNPTAQFKQTSPTRGMAGNKLHMQQEFVDRSLPPSVSQAPKNPVLFYGMNV